MKFLLFGGAGQLGFELLKRAHDLNFSMVAPVVSEVDIANPEQVAFVMERTKPTVVINVAAYTAVDKAEQEPEQAERVNCEGARVVAAAAKKIGAHLIHVSTDYVFDGAGSTLLSESSPTNPQSVYGRTKLAGEQEIHKIYRGQELIVRTASLHGQRGENFVHTMLKLFGERELVKVVSDQIMSPTWAGWLAEALLDLSRLMVSGRTDVCGVLHAGCSGAISWFEFATAIHQLGRPLEGGSWKARVEPIPMTELVRPAKRPQFSAFDLTRISKLLGRPPIDWRVGLKNHLSEIGRLAI